MADAVDQVDPEFSGDEVKLGKPRLLEALGPGLITGASDDDPSGIATYSQVGAQFGYGLSWTLLVSYPLMCAVQDISGRIGRATGQGLAAVLASLYPTRLVQTLVALLLIANTINIGADLSAMGEALALIVPGPPQLFVLMFGVGCILAQVFLEYARYVSVLKWLTLSLFAYFGALMLVKIPWAEAVRGLFIPKLQLNADFWMAIVAIFGTTISPYLFFWQAAEEVEEIKENPRREPLVDAPQQTPGALRRIRTDTLVGMGLSNLVAIAIMFTAAATLHASGVTTVESAAKAAEALKPVAGQFAFAIFALGIVGTGLLAVPVLAGSAAYSVGELMKVPVGLARRPIEAKAFYGIIALATLGGIALGFTPIDPMKALFWSAIVNGIVAVPVMACMMRAAGRPDVMGEAVAPRGLTALGWLATATMAACGLTMIISLATI